MSEDMIFDYFRVLVFEDFPRNISLSKEFIEKEELSSKFKDYFRKSISRYDPDQVIAVEDYTSQIFEELDTAGLIISFVDPAAGKFYWADLRKVAAYMTTELAQSEIYERRSRLKDDKFYKRAFEGLLNRVNPHEQSVTETILPSPSLANRAIALDKSDPRHAEIAEGLEIVKAEFQASNSAGETAAEREQIIKSMSAAQELWSSTQLKIVQIQIGVIMAVDDALNALRAVGKDSAKSMLVDIIKRFVRENVGIDI